jgi:hypothetical protein
MRHLTLEELARLVDEPPTEPEAAHLAGCGECTVELRALQFQSKALGSLTDLSAPAGQWRTIEGKMDPSVAVANQYPKRAALRVAAAVFLFLLGAATGVLSPWGEGSRESVGTGEADSSGPLQAAAELAAAEAEYLRALTSYVAWSDDGVGLDPLNRLAALEGIVLTTRAALRDAPADPVINNYHLTALGHREALLRQLEAAEAEWF